MVGNGVDTYFWMDHWLRGIPFKERYMRLYELTNNRGLSVTNMCSLGWGEGGET